MVFVLNGINEAEVRLTLVILPLTSPCNSCNRTLKRPHADVRDVNQSPVAKRFTMGTKWVSRSLGECSSESFLRLSTALSLTTVSSTVAKLSRGGYRSKIAQIYTYTCTII